MSKPKINIDLNKPQPTKSRLEESLLTDAKTKVEVNTDLEFGRKNYMYLLGGCGLILIGYFLMAGGNMPSPDVWDESIIYSTTRTVIAPIFMLAGLGMQIFTIFGKKD
jgi:hypothetical protein